MPLAFRLAVARETEEGLEKGLGVERRPELDPHRRLPFAAVPPTVGCTGRNRRLLPDVEVALLALDLERHPTGGDSEALLLARMAVRRGNRSPRAEVEVGRQQLTTGACRRLDPDDALAADRVLDRLADLRHRTTLPARAKQVRRDRRSVHDGGFVIGGTGPAGPEPLPRVGSAGARGG